MAGKIGQVPLSHAELGTTGPIYLWFYPLKEAELRHNDGRLGAIGALIVTEVLLGLLDVTRCPTAPPTRSGRKGVYQHCLGEALLYISDLATDR